MIIKMVPIQIMTMTIVINTLMISTLMTSILMIGTVFGKTISMRWVGFARRMILFCLILGITSVSIVSCKTVQIVDREYLASPIMNIDDTGYDICRLQVRRVELNPGGMGGVSYGGCITCGL